MNDTDRPASTDSAIVDTAVAMITTDRQPGSAGGGQTKSAPDQGGQPGDAPSPSVPKKKPGTAVSDFSPDDLVIVQKRQGWRERMAKICLDHFETCDREKIVSQRMSPDGVRALIARYDKISDCIKRDLSDLLVTGVTVHELEAVRYSVNYFLEEVVRHLRNDLQKSQKVKSPLLGARPEDMRRHVKVLLEVTPDAMLVFVDDLVKLGEFEIEVGTQRERIRLLLGGDRSLSALGNNEAIMSAKLEELWHSIEDFTSVYTYLKEYLPPILKKASPYATLEEELEVALEQFHGLVEDRIEPFEQRVVYKYSQDRVLRELEAELDEMLSGANAILGARVVPLRRQTAAGRTSRQMTVPEINHLYGALRAMGERLGRIPAELALPEPQTPMDSRGENHGNDLGELVQRLGDVLAEQPLLRQTVLLGRGTSDELPERADLEEMLAEAEERLGNLCRVLENASGEVRKVRQEKMHSLREHYCTLVGELRTFLQTSFAHIASKDPRSTESSYHFFLREFSNEAHQAVLLLKEIRDLEVFINGLRTFNIAGLPLTPENLARILRVLFIDKDDEKKQIPSGEGWKVMAAFLVELKGDLVPRLQRVCALDGIRYEDKNFLSEWAMELTRNCTLCLAQHEIGYSLLQEMGRLRDDSGGVAVRQSYLHIVTAKTCKAMQQSLTEICMTLTASIPYVGIMKGGIERRASVFFHQQQKLLENASTEPGAKQPGVKQPGVKPPES